MSQTNGRRAPVIADVARVAGVSKPTVSRVLSGSTPVSEELRARVERAIAELSYRPNSAARSLALGRQSMIAVFTGNTSRYGWSHTIQGIEMSARRQGLSAIVSVVESSESRTVNRALDLVLGESVAGVIVLEFDEPGHAVLRAMPPSLPVVAVAGGTRRSGPVPYALLDERTAGRKLTEYLLQLGHPTVHHVAQPTMGRATGRTAGWRAALAAAGAVIPEVLHASWDPASGYRIGAELAGRDDVSAVFCANDDLAMACSRALVDGGRRIPEDVSVVGFDNHPLAQFWQPALTTVHQDFDDLGARAFSVLAEILAGGRPRSSVSTPTLVHRESAGTYRGERRAPG